MRYDDVEELKAKVNEALLDALQYTSGGDPRAELENYIRNQIAEYERDIPESQRTLVNVVADRDDTLVVNVIPRYRLSTIKIDITI